MDAREDQGGCKTRRSSDRCAWDSFTQKTNEKTARKAAKRKQAKTKTASKKQRMKAKPKLARTRSRKRQPAAPVRQSAPTTAASTGARLSEKNRHNFHFFAVPWQPAAHLYAHNSGPVVETVFPLLHLLRR
jgi:hypothetical protein